jgi:hypothetical protein
VVITSSAGLIGVSAITVRTIGVEDVSGNIGLSVVTGLRFLKRFNFLKEKLEFVNASVPSMANNNNVTSTTGADDFFFHYLHYSGFTA